MSQTIKNEIILASAGSGKTYRLTNRFIALMMLDVAPERIIALTFTRKAAGEFFDAILQKLADAATDPDKAAQIADDIANAEFTSGKALTLLRRFIDTMPRLALGTLDSFFADIVRAFPFEFGLGGGFDILDTHGQRIEKDRVYRNVFDKSADGAGEFLDSFKLATFGREDAGIMRNLERFIDELHETFLSSPAAERWGNASAIWRGGLPWHQLHPQALGNVINMLAEGFNSSGVRDKIVLRWQRFFNWVLGHEAGSPVPRDEKTLFGNLLAIVDDLERGEGRLNVDGCKHEPDPAECDFLYQIVGHLVAGELQTRLRRTRGLWMVLSGYEGSYDSLVRRRGKLTFADLTLLLAKGGSADRVFSAVGGRREQIEYRLDAAYDHWLLDEFQDTSALQWKAIENLVDEAAFDPEERRSLFQVGDLKQAIYAWRGGDATLFSDLREKYRTLGPHRFHEEPLDKSYRSSPAVIDGVNSIFGDTPAITGLFPAMAKRWEFGTHTTAHTDRPGYTGWIAAEKLPLNRPKEADKLPGRLDIVADILRDIDPLRRGLSVAVLVARNSTGQKVTEHLRAHTDLAVTNAADIGIAGDNPLTVALRSLFRAAAHPGDTFARGHLLMTPFAEHLAEEPAAHSAAVLRSVWQSGFEATTRAWLARLPTTLDIFSASRAEDFARAAARFDATGERSIDGFLRFIDSYTTRDLTSGGSVQVMTIHKSKGLGFDVVILPELGGDSLDSPRREIGVQRDGEREIDWVLQIPNKDLAQADPTLRAFLEQRAADVCYENLCRYYVALTRAKFANYLVTDVRANSSSHNFVKLLEHTLGASTDETSGLIHEIGDPSWFTNLPPAVTSP